MYTHIWNRLKDQCKELGDTFFGIDTRALGALRVGVSLIVLYDFIFERLPHLSAHYGIGSVFPPELIEYHIWTSPAPFLFSLLQQFPYLPLVILLSGISGAIFLLIGWHTRAASIGVWLAVVLIQFLNPVVLQGGDVYLRLILFIGIFLPWGLVYSVDQALSFQSPPKRIRSAWVLALFVQIASVYVFAVLSKTGVEWTRDGTAVYYALSLDQFSTPIGEFTRQFPTLMTALTFAVICVQTFAVFLLFSPVYTTITRSVAIILLMGMHIAFALHMNLGPFSFVASVALLAYVPTRVWDWCMSIFERHFGHLTIYFDGDCGFCKKSSYLLRTFLALPNTAIIPAESNELIQKEMDEKDSWVIVTRDHAHHYTYGGGIALLRASPLFFWLAPLLNISPLHPIGERVYRFIANHRSRVCLPDVPRKEYPRLIHDIVLGISTMLALIYIVSILSWNYSNLTYKRFTVAFPEAYVSGMRLIAIDQWWNMFSPYPLKEDGWYAIQGTLANGETVNLLNEGAPVPTREKPVNGSALYPDERWRKYLMNLWSSDYSVLRNYYLSYLCRSWNSTHTGDTRVVNTEITFMLERTLPYPNTAPIEPVSLGTMRCEE